MPEMLFALDKANYRNCQELFRGERKQDYYRGDYWVDDATGVEVQAEKRAIGPYAIIQMRAAMSQYFRRNQRHIREDATDMCVLWFVRRGTMTFSSQNGSQVVNPGDFLVTRSMSPFFMELQPDDSDAVLEVLHVTVPTHLARLHIGHEVRASSFIAAGRREVAIGRSMLADLFALDDGELAEDTSQLLVESAIKLLGHALRDCAEAMSLRQTVADRRLEEVQRFIEVHLSDPNLCTTMVSEGCGVSQRYLSLLLQMSGKTFSELVWSRRLQLAREWLERSDPRDVAISEIAYGVGFKSTAHFSRKFKKVFGSNPRDFRARSLEARAAPVEQLATQHSATLQ